MNSQYVLTPDYRKVPASKIKRGDTVLCQGGYYTVTKVDLRKGIVKVEGGELPLAECYWIGD